MALYSCPQLARHLNKPAPNPAISTLRDLCILNFAVFAVKDLLTAKYAKETLKVRKVKRNRGQACDDAILARCISFTFRFNDAKSAQYRKSDPQLFILDFTTRGIRALENETST